MIVIARVKFVGRKTCGFQKGKQKFFFSPKEREEEEDGNDDDDC
jgi:hypothetical protein